MQRPWRTFAYWLAPHGLLSPLSYSTQDYQLRGDPTQSDLDSITSIINQENKPRACPQVNLDGGHFLN